MALGWTGEVSNVNNISLKLVAEAWPTEVQPKLVVKAKNEDTGKYELTEDRYQKISGKVISIRTSHNGKEGLKEVKGFVACLQDGDERYYIDATMTNASKDIANHILASIGQVVSIGLYLNKNQYPTASVKLENGEYAPTHFEFNGLDKDKLWDAIKAQEADTTADNSATVEDVADVFDQESEIEDLPF